MPGLAHHFFTMAANNAWSNHRLLAACAQLSQEDFVATRTSFFPSLKSTLNHIVTVDWYYVDAIERALREQPANTNAGRFFDPEEPFATVRQFRQRSTPSTSACLPRAMRSPTRRWRCPWPSRARTACSRKR
jgi:uncharacterized damage-inducible protein DinB